MEVRVAKKSLGTRIFVFVTVLVVGLVAFMSGKNGLYLLESLKRQYQASLIDSVQLQGQRMAGVLGRLDTKIFFMSQMAPGMSPKDLGEFSKALKNAEAGLIAVQFAQRDKLGQWSLLGTSEEKSALTREELTRLKLDQQPLLQVHPRTRSLLLLAREQRLASGEASLVLLIVESRSLLAGIRPNSQQSYFLIDRTRKDLFSGKSYEKFFSDKKLYRKVEDLLQKELGSGYLGEMRFAKNRYYVAYQSLQPYPVTLVVHQEIDLIQKAIIDFFTEILQWTILFVLLSILLAWYLVKGLISHLQTLTLAVQELAKGHFEVRVPVRTEDEIGYLSSSFNWMTKKLVGLLEKEREKARIEQELVTAQTVQSTFFKRDRVETSVMTLHAHYKPASECSGDLWGHVKIRDGMELVFLGDATGHGAPAALITALAYATVNIRSALYNNREVESLSPSQILKALNELLWETLQGKLCMSFVILIFDHQKGSVLYANAGHTFPFLVPKDADDSRLSGKKRLKSLSSGRRTMGILGIDPGAEFFDEELDLKSGDRIILYTDGLTEAKNDKGKQWGTRSLQKVVEDLGDAPPEELKTELVQRVVSFNEKGEQFEDDLTLLIIDFHPQRETQAA